MHLKKTPENPVRKIGIVEVRCWVKKMWVNFVSWDFSGDFSDVVLASYL